MPAAMFAEAAIDEHALPPAHVDENAALIVDLPRGKRLSNYPAASPALVAAALTVLQ